MTPLLVLLSDDQNNACIGHQLSGQYKSYKGHLKATSNLLSENLYFFRHQVCNA